jgi:hypothetical protein
MAVLLTLFLLTRNAVNHGPPNSRPALRMRGGGSPSVVRTVVAVEEVQPSLRGTSAAVARGEAGLPQPSHAPPPRWPAGSGLVIALLYLVALVNGLARRTLSCAAPVLERDGLFTKAELEGVYMGGYQSFALGRAFAAPIISRLGSKRALLLQLATLSLSCTGFCASAGRPALQASCWALVRLSSAMTISIMLPLVRLWVPRDAYGKVWGLLQSGVQTGGLLAYAWYGHRLAQGPGALPWRAPFALAAALCALAALLCGRLLRAERPAAPTPLSAATGRAPAATRTAAAAAAAAATTSAAGSGAAGSGAAGSGAAGSGKLLPRGLLRRFAAKPQFWLMLLAVGTYTPIYEYGTFVSNYLKQLEIGRDSPASGAATALHCIENQAWLTLTLTLTLSLTLTPTLTLTCTASRTRRARRAWRSTS